MNKSTAGFISDLLSESTSSSEKGFFNVSIPTPNGNWSDMVRIVRLEYPKDRFVEYTYSWTGAGKKCKLGVVKITNDKVHLIKVLATSELSGLKTCVDNYSNSLLIFNIDTQKILHCSRKDMEDKIKEIFIDRWDELSKKNHDMIVIPDSLIK